MLLFQWRFLVLISPDGWWLVISDLNPLWGFAQVTNAHHVEVESRLERSLEDRHFTRKRSQDNNWICTYVRFEPVSADLTDLHTTALPYEHNTREKIRYHNQPAPTHSKLPDEAQTQDQRHWFSDTAFIPSPGYFKPYWSGYLSRRTRRAWIDC